MDTRRDVTLLKAKQADANDSYLYRVAFSFQHTGGELTIQDQYQTQDGEWRRQDQVRFTGAKTVTVLNAFIRENQDGQWWINSDMRVPASVERAVISLIEQEAAAHEGGEVSAVY